MSMQFYYGSGSPFAWNVWLTLEHKQLPYEMQLMSLSNGELKKPAYLAIHPHGKVPALIDEGFILWETLPIIEYLEERYPARPLFPIDSKAKAVVRRLSAEAYNYLYPVMRKLLDQTLLTPDTDSESATLTETVNQLGMALTYFDQILKNDYFAGDLSAADFTIYPLLALVRRIDQKAGMANLNQSNLLAFMARIEQLPYFNQTRPPHWQEA